MPAPPRRLDRFALVLTSALCFCWGFNQVATKLAFADFGPVTQCALRSAIGSAAVALYAAFARPSVLRSDGSLGAGLLVGSLFALEFILVFLAAKLTTAASAIVFLFTAPFFVALGAVLLLPGERLAARQWVGVAIAFAGVAAGLYRPAEGSSLFGDCLALLAGAAWGATTLAIKTTKLRKVDPVKTLLYQTVVSAVIAPFVAAGFGEHWPASISWLSIAAVGYQAVFVVGVTYIAWFWLLTIYRAPELSALTFVSPAVGVLAGWIVLGERPTVFFGAALILIAAGIVLVSWPPTAPQAPAPAE